MDWRTTKFDWNRARAFLVTAEEGSLSAAAKALGMTQPTLGRQVTALTPGIECVLPGLSPIPVPFYLTTHRALHTSRRIRVVFNGLADALGQDWPAPTEEA